MHVLFQQFVNLRFPPPCTPHPYGGKEIHFQLRTFALAKLAICFLWLDWPMHLGLEINLLPTNNGQKISNNEIYHIMFPKLLTNAEATRQGYLTTVIRKQSSWGKPIWWPRSLSCIWLEKVIKRVESKHTQHEHTQWDAGSVQHTRVAAVNTVVHCKRKEIVTNSECEYSSSEQKAAL